MKAKKILKITALVLLFSVFFIILIASFYAFSVVKGVKFDKNALESTNAKKVVIFDASGDEIDFFGHL